MNTTRMNQRLLQYSPETEGFEALEEMRLKPIARPSTSATSVFSEGQLLELAADLLEDRSEEALDRTLVQIINRAARLLGNPVNPLLAQALQGALRDIARHELTFAGRTLGVPMSIAGAVSKDSYVARTGRQTFSRATHLFGLELEGLSPEDKEFELAKGFVRLAGAAVRHAIAQSQAASPRVQARRAVAQAAHHETPGPFLNFTGERVGVHHFTATNDSKELTMHDIDRTQMEYSNEFSGFEGEQFEFGENEWSPEAGGTFSEAEEMELATELLSVSNEGELDRFLGNLLSRATKAVGSFARSPIGQAVGGVLKGVAKKALPLAGGALGAYVGGPLGAKIGSGLASAASSALGLEAEMANEDREFEGAKQFVRLAAQTASNATNAPQGADPRAVAQQAALSAAKQFAPGLLPGGALSGASLQSPRASGALSGRWLRRGNKIVIYGA